MHPVEQPIARRIISPGQRPLEGKRVRRAMGFEDQTPQAQQRTAAVTAVVDPVLEALEHRHGDQRGQLGQRRAGEFLLDELAHHAGQAFAGLEQHIADKAIADHQVGGALEDVVTFDVAVEVDLASRRRAAQQLAGLLDHLAALGRLFADVEQADAGLFGAVECTDQRTAHHRKLQQVLGRAVDVGTEVEHLGEAAQHVGQQRGNGRAVDAVEGLQHITGERHQRTGVAGRDADIGARQAVVTAFELADRHPHR